MRRIPIHLSWPRTLYRSKRGTYERKASLFPGKESRSVHALTSSSNMSTSVLGASGSPSNLSPSDSGSPIFPILRNISSRTRQTQGSIPGMRSYRHNRPSDLWVDRLLAVQIILQRVYGGDIQIRPIMTVSLGNALRGHKAGAVFL
jgi:hypothetical protein